MFYFTSHISRSLSVLFRYAPHLTRSALWNFNQKMFVSLQKNPLRRTFLPMTYPLSKSNWTLLSCRASLALRISTTRTSPTTLVKSTIQLTVIGPWLNHTRNGPVDDPTLNAIGSIALGSTTKLCLGITITLNFTNLQLGISSMITQLLIGHILSHAFGAPGAGN